MLIIEKKLEHKSSNTKRLCFILDKEYDKELIKLWNSKTNKSKYIRNLMRQDIKRNGGEF